MIVGTEWLVEATGCDRTALRDEAIIRALFSSAIADLGLKSVGAVWHKFEGEGGVTGLVALTESHLACHTYPEHGTATFNLYCCRTRPEWDWEGHLMEALGAAAVTVTKFERGETRLEISNHEYRTQNEEVEAETLEFKYLDQESPHISASPDTSDLTSDPDTKFEIAGGKQ